MKLSLLEIALALGLAKPERSFTVTQVSTDSRNIGEGGLFAALKGEKFDGHDFVERIDQSFDDVAFLVERKIEGVRGEQLVCDNVLEALADIAALHVGTLPAKRLAVTGSVGKTTTKEMLAVALSAKYKTQKSIGNRNNELGMPLTAFSADESHEAIIFEMGMRGRGQIDYLARRVCPQIGVITNIGTSHIELLGSRENICAAKMELADHIAENGVLVINGDEPLLLKAAKEKKINFSTFGIENPCDFFAKDITYFEDRTRFTVQTDEGDFVLEIPAAGRHIVYDALAAFAAAAKAGVPMPQICQKLSLYHDGGLRQNIYTENGITFFDDTYNASPESMMAALSVLARFPTRKVAVLADMLELGTHSEKAHRSVGEACQKNGVDLLICYGTDAKYIAEQAQIKNSACFANREEALEHLVKCAKKEDVILFKGSNAMQTGSLLTEFKKRWAQK